MGSTVLLQPQWAHKSPVDLDKMWPLIPSVSGGVRDSTFPPEPHPGKRGQRVLCRKDAGTTPARQASGREGSSRENGGGGKESRRAGSLTQATERPELLPNSTVVEVPDKRSFFWKLGCCLLGDTMNRFERCELGSSNISTKNC